MPTDPTTDDYDEITREFLASVSLGSGTHTEETGACFMEAAVLYRRRVLHVPREQAQWTDQDETVDPVIRRFAIRWNDGLRSNEERDRLLRPLIPLAVGTRGSSELEKRRGMRCLDWVIRRWLPAWLDLVVATQPHAARLRELPPVTDDTAEAAGAVVREANTAASAARSAAESAAGSAAGSAARSVLEPTVLQLQGEASALLRELCLMTDDTKETT